MTGQEYGVERVAIQVVLEVDPTVFRAADLAADVTDYLVEVLGVCQMAAAGNLEALVVRPMTGAAAKRALRDRPTAESVAPCPGAGRAWQPGTGVPMCPVCRRGYRSIGVSQRPRKGGKVPAHTRPTPPAEGDRS